MSTVLPGITSVWLTMTLCTRRESTASHAHTLIWDQL